MPDASRAVMPILVALAAFGLGCQSKETALLRSHMAANEALAAESLRALNTAAVNYIASYGKGYPPSLAAMGPPPDGRAAATCTAANLIDSALVSGQKSGYHFTYIAAKPDPAAAAPNCGNPGFTTYTIHADPITRGTSGRRSFFTDESGVIRSNTAQPASASDPPLD
jgi:type IV pilus assembly protein PilA